MTGESIRIPHASRLLLSAAASLLLAPSIGFTQTTSFATAKTFAAGAAPQSAAVGDFDKDGILDLAVTNIDNKVAVLRGLGDGNFAPVTATTKFAVGRNPIFIVTADFDGDGNLDLATANNSPDNNISILLGAGDGTFPTFTNFPAGGFPRAIGVGDFNRDGIPDLAVANQKTDNLSIFLGVGDGTFSAPTNIPVGNSPVSVAVGDLNRDGKLDLAVGNLIDSVSILLGNGDGTFTPGTTLTSVGEVSSVAIADLDGDGMLDLAVTIAGLINRVSIRWGLGNGLFDSTPVNFNVGSNPQFVAVGDWNGDGIFDVATANAGAGKVSIIPGAGARLFGTILNFSAKTGPRSIAVGDFNSDAKPDLAVANSGSTTVAILLNTSAFSGAGDFETATNSGVEDAPVAAAVGDFNRDGIPDLAVTNTGASNTISILLGDGAGAFSGAAGSPFGVGTAPSSVAVGDFNRDGILDLAVANHDDDNVTVVFGDGDGTFDGVAPVTVNVGSDPSSVAVGDFNRDGNLDFVVVISGDDNVTVVFGDGDGTFDGAAPVTVNVGSDPSSVAVGDFNRDGNLDFVVANSGDDNVTVVFGDGDGTFDGIAAVTINVGIDPSAVAVGDFNRDGNLDFVAANSGDDNVTVVFGDGDGTFDGIAAGTFGVGTAPSSVVAADFNRDGNLDLAVANAGDDAVSILLGDGSGSFSDAVSSIFGSPYGVGDKPRALVAGDFDRDGRSDLITANEDTDNVSLLLNTSPPPTILSPLGGETWTIGSTQTIKWVFSDGGAAVNVQLSRNGGATWKTIFKKTPNDGVQTWKVLKPATTPNQAVVRVCKLAVVTPATDCTPVSGGFTIQ